MQIHKKAFPFIFLLFYFTAAYTQTSFDSSYTEAAAVYEKTIGVNKHLYNGSEYIDYDHRIAGNPFFMGMYFTNGSIVYDGILYNDVQLFYDVLNDEVIIRNYNTVPLLLSKEKISLFNIAGNYFIKVTEDSSASAARPGFYQVLYDGKTKLFAKRKKEIKEIIRIEGIESSFNVKDSYYILKDDIFYPADDKRAVLHIMKDKKNELTKFIHQNKLKFKKDKENVLIKTVAYYDSLKSAK